MKWTRALGSGASFAGALCVAVALWGCGGDDSGEDNSGGAGASGDMTATPTGAGGTTGSGTTGTGTTGTGTTGADPDAGAAFNPADLLAMFQPTCDSTITAETSCGSTTCPAPGMLAALTCSVSCCVNDECGTRSAVEGMVTECALPPPPAEEDPNCPAYVGMGMGGNGLELPGCCTPEGVCGVISSISNTCITQSMFLTDLQPGGPCDGSGGDDADAGM